MKNQPLLAAALVVCGFAAAAEAGPRSRARAEERQEKREEIQEKRDERRDEAADAIDAKRDEAKKKAYPGVNRRQRRQGSRIVGGVRSGQLTPAEVDALAAREAALRTLEANAKADGALTEAERKSLHGELQTLSRQIRTEKTDADKTGKIHIRDGVDGDRKNAAQARRLAEVRRELNKPSLTPAQRAVLETEHTALVDSLFEEEL